MAQTYTKISALTKGLAILNIIGSSPKPVMARDIAEQAGITYSTAMNNIIQTGLRDDARRIQAHAPGRLKRSRCMNDNEPLQADCRGSLS